MFSICDKYCLHNQHKINPITNKKKIPELKIAPTMIIFTLNRLLDN
jgi:hypothetical protein